MSRRALRYADAAAAIADVERLRQGHTTEGQWTLSQAANHCGWPLQLPMVPATTTAATEEQQPFRDFLDRVNAAGVWPEAQIPSPPQMAPPPDAEASNVDRYVAGLRKLADCDVPVLENQAFGPVPLEAFRRFALIHAAHHFSFFHPTA